MDYVNNYYSRETYGVYYDHKVTSINGIDMWSAIEFDDIQPPKYKKGPGRPKKLRKKEPDENPNRSRLIRDQVPYKCSRSRAIGHNTRRCPLPPLIVPEEQNEEPSGAAEGVGQGATQGAADGVQPGQINVGQGVTRGTKKGGKNNGKNTLCNILNE